MKHNMKIHSVLLQPLRIPECWLVEHNRFYELDPPYSPESDDWIYFSEDMLLLRNHKKNLLLDLSWIPSEDSKGVFISSLAFEENWQEPVCQIETKSRMEVVEFIDRALMDKVQW